VSPQLEGYTLTLANFTGLMAVGGVCVTTLHDNLANCSGGAGSILEAAAQGALAQQFVSTDGEATLVTTNLALDPNSAVGASFVDAMRVSLRARQFVDGVDIGRIYIVGQTWDELDTARAVFGALPGMVGLMLAIVLVVFGIAFRSLVVPVRAMLCVVWMLVLTFGASAYIIQDDATGGGVYWMAPSFSLAICVGLALDYDIFLMESVQEHVMEGASVNEAVLAALDDTANVVTAAGVIMLIAFIALAASSTAALQQIGILLICGVGISTLLTTKVVIPAAMGALPEWANFWPRTLPYAEQQRRPHDEKTNLLLPSSSQKADQAARQPALAAVSYNTNVSHSPNKQTPVDVPEATPPERSASMLLVACAAVLVSELNYASITPFFPEYAREVHDQDAVTIGIIFGAMGFGQLLMSLMAAATIIAYVGPTRALVASLLFQAGVTVLFGVTLSPWTSKLGFALYTSTLRILMGAASSLTDIAAASMLISAATSETLTSDLGLLEAQRGLAFLVGPFLGGFLYPYGVQVPFFANGGLLLLAAGGAVFAVKTGSLPGLAQLKGAEPDHVSRQQLVRVWPVVSVLIAMTMAISLLTGTLPVIEPHYRAPPFNLNERDVAVLLGQSVVFLIAGSVLTGMLQAHIGQLRLLTFGTVLAFFGLLLLAPSPLLPFLPSDSLVLTIIALDMTMIAQATSLVLAGALMVRAATAHGFRREAAANSIGSLMSTATSLGNLVGAPLGGVLVQAVGFPWMMTTFGLIGLAQLVHVLPAFHFYSDSSTGNT